MNQELSELNIDCSLRVRGRGVNQKRTCARTLKSTLSVKCMLFYAVITYLKARTYSFDYGAYDLHIKKKLGLETIIQEEQIPIINSTLTISFGIQVDIYIKWDDQFEFFFLKKVQEN